MTFHVLQTTVNMSMIHPATMTAWCGQVIIHRPNYQTPASSLDE